MSTILFVDGENFVKKLKEFLVSVHKAGDFYNIDFDKLFKKALGELTPARKIFYAAKLHIHDETKKKSIELIAAQRKLKNILTNSGFEFTISGNVRVRKFGNKLIFTEKGVDVRIAVDLVSLACDKALKTAVICSSDSDLQPAIIELKKRGVRVVYLGFESNPNKGLIFTSNRTILFRPDEILDSIRK